MNTFIFNRCGKKIGRFLREETKKNIDLNKLVLRECTGQSINTQKK